MINELFGAKSVKSSVYGLYDHHVHFNDFCLFLILKI